MGEVLGKVFAPLHQGVIPTLKPALWSVKEFTVYYQVLLSGELLMGLFEALGNDVGEFGIVARCVKDRTKRIGISEGSFVLFGHFLEINAASPFTRNSLCLHG
jgi:hypothetical protein